MLKDIDCKVRIENRPPNDLLIISVGCCQANNKLIVCLGLSVLLSTISYLSVC